MSESDLKESMFNEQNQHFEEIEWSEEGAELLEALMGSDSSPKKDFVFNNIDFSEVEYE